MGNTNQFCGKNTSKQDKLTQIACSLHNQRTSQLKVAKNIQKITVKPYFHYILPIQFSQEQIISQTHILQDENNQNLNKINTQQDKAGQQINQTNTLQNILNQQQQKLEGHRVAVNWHSFIKIKNKNYLEDYVFIKELGKGAYGSVFKMKMKYGGIARAAKVIKSALILTNTANAGKLFSQISVPMRLDHPNIAKLYEVFQWRGQFILIMQLCEGGDLFSNIKKSRYFAQAKAAQIMKQILSAVNYMHKQKVMHRDLKPENILIDQQNNFLKITDFGTSIFFNDSEKQNEFVGTPYYMAPQIIDRCYNQKCDVWSCGIIMYILLCGSPPFNGKTETQILQNIKMKPLQFKNSIWSRRKQPCKDLIMKMLNKNPEERISAEQALRSPWITNTQPKEDKEHLEEMELEVMNNLREFHFTNKLKAVVYTFIASQLYSNKDKQNLRKVFQEMDTDGDGVIERHQLLNIFNHHSQSHLTEVQISNILHIIDTNGSGKIDFTQFIVAASNEAKMLDERRLQNAFNYLDADHSGFITIDEVKSFLDNSNQTNDQIKKLFDEVDFNGDGEISKKEFVALLLKKN